MLNTVTTIVGRSFGPKKKPSTSDVKASMNQGITTNELVALAPMMLERIMRKIIAK